MTGVKSFFVCRVLPTLIGENTTDNMKLVKLLMYESFRFSVIKNNHEADVGGHTKCWRVDMKAPNLVITIMYIGISCFLVVLNAFFVAAEFAIVKVRRTRLE